MNEEGSPQWRAVVNGVLYTVQFSPSLDEESALTHVVDLLRTRPLYGAPPTVIAGALRRGLDSGEELASGIPQPHDEVAVRGFLERVVKRIQAVSGDEEGAG